MHGLPGRNARGDPLDRLAEQAKDAGAHGVGAVTRIEDLAHRRRKHPAGLAIRRQREPLEALDGRLDVALGIRVRKIG